MDYRHVCETCGAERIDQQSLGRPRCGSCGQRARHRQHRAADFVPLIRRAVAFAARMRQVLQHGGDDSAYAITPELGQLERELAFLIDETQAVLLEPTRSDTTPGVPVIETPRYQALHRTIQ